MRSLKAMAKWLLLQANMAKGGVIAEGTVAYSLTQVTTIRTTPLGSLRLCRWLVREAGSAGDLVGWSFGLP